MGKDLDINNPDGQKRSLKFNGKNGREMINNSEKPSPFEVKDCALIGIATGKRAQSLRELREYLLSVDPSSIYYHFWGGLLRPRFDDPEYHNDFAVWANRALHDKILAERLALIIPTDYKDIEALRQDLIDNIDERLDEIEYPLWASSDNHFEFLKTQIVIFSTHYRVEYPEQFMDVIPSLSLGSIFYHFIDARRRTPNVVDDFRAWIYEFGEKYHDLCERMHGIDPYFLTLSEMRTELAKIFRDHFSYLKK